MSETLSARPVHTLPILGPLARVLQKEVGLIWYVLVLMAAALVLAVETWGLVALTLTALAFVPVMFVLLLVIARP